MNYDELNKLNELKEKGILTEEEFQKEKEKILNSNETATTQQSQPYTYQDLSTNSTQNTEQSTSNNATPQKSKLVAGLLGIFLGAFGVHNFYLGFNNKAVAQLLITILSCGLLSVVSGIWGLVEGILILTGEKNTDAQGNPLKND